MTDQLKIEEYSQLHTTEECESLQELVRETNIKVLMPRMLSGKIQGKFLEMICFMANPKNILEIGTFTGYSAISMAKALNNDGKLYTVDKNTELKFFLEKYAKKTAVDDKIIHIIDNALNVIPILDIIFDLVFIDADKENYLKYYELVLPKTKKGGFIIADNVLWSGKVVENLKHGDKDTAAIMEFNDFVQNDKRVENVLLPVRDGLMIMRKL